MCTNVPLFSYWLINILLAFIVSAIFAGTLIPKILLISFRKRLFDTPDERKKHQGIVPRLGGIVFKPAICFSIVLILGLNHLTGRHEVLSSFQQNFMPLAFGFCTVMLLYLTGIADDLIGMRYRTKFAVQITCATMLTTSGVTLPSLYGLFGIYTLSPALSYSLTILIVVFIINAINLIDGIDGLAAGLSCIALIFYTVFFILARHYVYALIAAATLGSIVPFFYYNVFGCSSQKRKIFMGDTGSLTIGIILSFLSINLCLHTPTSQSPFNPLVLAFSPLIIPCFDVLRVFLHRLRTGNPPFHPDRNHIHHKFLDAGWSAHRVLIALLLAAVAINAINFYLCTLIDFNWLLLGNVFCWTLFHIGLTSHLKNKYKNKYKS